MFSFIAATVYEILTLNKFYRRKKKNLTSISHYNQPIIVLFAFLAVKVAFYKFSTLLLITFDLTAGFRSNFFQTVCSYKAHPPKRFEACKL